MQRLRRSHSYYEYFQIRRQWESMSIKEDLYSFAGVKQHSEFEAWLRSILFDREKRESFYRSIVQTDWGKNVGEDSFKGYFEEYAAERKANKQDYTPESIAILTALITRNNAENMRRCDYSAIDPTAGTGSLIIRRWWDDCLQTTIFKYRPHDFFYYCEEMADNAIPYLLHNLALRGMNCIVVHGDCLEREIKNIYFVQNAQDDCMTFSSINVMPRNDLVTQEFNVRKWVGEAIDHIEDDPESVRYVPGGEMTHKGIQENTDYEKNIKPYVKLHTATLKDVAEIERAKAKKVYPPGTIIIQMSATRGQIGMLTSSGEVMTHYAAIQFIEGFNPEYMFYYLKHTAHRHFRRVQEGLNLTLENIATIPISNWVIWLGLGVTPC